VSGEEAIDLAILDLSKKDTKLSESLILGTARKHSEEFGKIRAGSYEQVTKSSPIKSLGFVLDNKISPVNKYNEKGKFERTVLTQKGQASDANIKTRLNSGAGKSTLRDSYTPLAALKRKNNKDKTVYANTDVMNVTFTKSALNFESHKRQMKQLESDPVNWEKRTKPDGSVIFTRRNPKEYHTKNIIYSSANERSVSRNYPDG